jgi:homoserine kinase
MMVFRNSILKSSSAAKLSNSQSDAEHPDRIAAAMYGGMELCFTHIKFIEGKPRANEWSSKYLFCLYNFT